MSIILLFFSLRNKKKKIKEKPMSASSSSRAAMEGHAIVARCDPHRSANAHTRGDPSARRVGGMATLVALVVGVSVLTAICHECAAG